MHRCPRQTQKPIIKHNLIIRYNIFCRTMFLMKFILSFNTNCKKTNLYSNDNFWPIFKLHKFENNWLAINNNICGVLQMTLHRIAHKTELKHNFGGRVRALPHTLCHIDHTALVWHSIEFCARTTIQNFQIINLWIYIFVVLRVEQTSDIRIYDGQMNEKWTLYSCHFWDILFQYINEFINATQHTITNHHKSRLIYRPRSV